MCLEYNEGEGERERMVSRFIVLPVLLPVLLPLQKKKKIIHELGIFIFEELSENDFIMFH